MGNGIKKHGRGGQTMSKEDMILEIVEMLNDSSEVDVEDVYWIVKEK